MHFLTDDEKARIADMVRDIERRTEGELVTVLAAASDRYRYIPLLWATLVALAVPAVWLPFGWGMEAMYPVQLLAFMAASVIMGWPPVRRWIIPRSVQQHRAERLAFEVFHRLGLHRTPHRAGVLLFVSVEERFVRILADSGIDERVRQEDWQAIVDAFVARVRRAEIAEGFTEAVQRCGSLLVDHYPASTGQARALPDVLVELPDSWL